MQEGQSGRFLRRPQQDYPAATVADFCTAVLTITSGDSYSEVSAQQYRVAKMFLLTNLSTLLQGELKIATNMSDVKELRSQIDNFAVSYSAAGNMQVNAAKGHDDLLLAASLAAFSATHVKRNFFMSTPISW